MNITYFKAVHSLVGGRLSGPTSGPVSEMDFKDNQTPPTEEVIQTEIVKLQAEYDALQYQRDRQPEYPAIADQLDYIYHNGIAKWKSDMIKPVKDAHPKP